MADYCFKCDRGWVCESHPEKPFQHDDCGGPGMPCTCIPKGVYPPNVYGLPDNIEIIAQVEETERDHGEP